MQVFRKLNKRFLLVGLGFFVVAAVAASTCSMGWTGGAISFWDTKASEWPQGGDTGSYREFAYSFLNGNFDNWTMSNWAPGYGLLVTLSIFLMGEEHHSPKMLFIHLILWAVAFFLVWKKVRFVESDVWRFLILAGIFWLPAFKEQAFGTGYLHSESLSHSFFVMALAFLLEGLIDAKDRSLYWGAFFLALAANCRSVLDYVLGACLLFVVAVTCVHFVLSCLYSRRESFLNSLKALRSSSEKSGPLWAFRTAVICFIVFQVTVSPWKIRNFIKYEKYRYTIVGSDYEWQFQWSLDENLPSIVKGSNSACHANMALCEVFNKNVETLANQRQPLAIMTLINHSNAWIKHRLKGFNYLWFGIPKPHFMEAPFNISEGLLYFLMFFICTVISLKDYFATRAAVIKSRLVAFLGSVYVFTFMNAGMLLILHFESRYSLTWRIGWLFAGLGAIAFHRTLNKKQKTF